MEAAAKTGIHRTTLSKIVNRNGYSTTTDNVNSLCNYFECNISDFAEHIKDSEENDSSV